MAGKRYFFASIRAKRCRIRYADFREHLFRNRPKRGSSNAPIVDLAGMRRVK